jgi:hypothetical protein
MFGAPRNAACKTSRFDCSFVISRASARHGLVNFAPNHQIAALRLDISRQGRPSDPARFAGSAAYPQSDQSTKLNYYSLLMPARMRITHAKSRVLITEDIAISSPRAAKGLI